MKLVAIHQPNFFPWLGYFDKIRRADAFVFLDDVQQQKTGGTWTNRVKMLVGGEARWVTAPIERAFSGVRRVCDIRFDESTPWRQRILKTLAANYGRAPCYAEAMTLLEPLISIAESNVAAYNIQAITAIAAALGLRTERFVRSASLETSGHGTDLLISIVRATGGATYLCGGGAEGYQEDEAFGRAAIRLLYQNLRHPGYPQVGAGEFVAGLSIVDAFMNCGVRGTAALLCD